MISMKTWLLSSSAEFITASKTSTYPELHINTLFVGLIESNQTLLPASLDPRLSFALKNTEEY